MTTRVYVDESLCQGHTLCHMAAPAIFNLRDEDGHAFVDDSLVPADMVHLVRTAEATCPEQAIRVEEVAD